MTKIKKLLFGSLKKIKPKNIFLGLAAFGLLIALFSGLMLVRKSPNTGRITNEQLTDAKKSSTCREGLTKLDGTNTDGLDESTKKDALEYLIACNRIAGNYDAALRHAYEYQQFVNEKGSEPEKVKAQLEIEATNYSRNFDDE